MTPNKLIELIRQREQNYVELTEKAIKMFISPLKRALESSFFDDKEIELYILDVSPTPQNINFLRIEGKFITHSVGDTLQISENEVVEVDIENIWDFSRPLVIIIPSELLSNGDYEEISSYLLKVKENGGKIPMSMMKNNKSPELNTKVTTFEKINKELDETQSIGLKYIKNSSIH